MNAHYPCWIFFFIVVLICSGVPAAEMVDPLNPSQWHEMQTAQSRTISRWLPTRIKQLETEQENLLRKISSLPTHEPRRLPDHLGYHSGVAEPDADGTFPEHWIEVSYKYPERLHSIALAPAFNPLELNSSTYAFPKRFKIEVQRASGYYQGDEYFQTSDQWTEVVNWMDEDFPDPGSYPVFFSDLKQRVVKVRLTVHGEQGDAVDPFYALGEIYLFRSKSKDKSWQMADNIAVWTEGGISFYASSTLSIPPLWDIRYLHDGLSGLGFPLSEALVDSEDFMVRFTGDEGHGQPVEITLDLGQTQRVGQIWIWPTKSPQHMAVPLFGFPGKIKVDLSNDPGFGTVETIWIGNTGEMIYHDSLLRILCKGYNARYIRLTTTDFREYQGHKILGLGEILVSEYGKLYPVKQISARGIPREEVHQLSRLVDGICRNRRILSEPEWIKGLAQLRTLARRLAVVEKELEDAREEWRVVILRLSIWGGCLLCVILLAAMGLQRLQRRRILRALRIRITRDLHDEVGSSLGSISLTSEQLESETSDAVMKEELGELALMAREACASLREVVWVADQDSIRLPELIDKLVERADRVLRNIDLEVDVPEACPDVEVSLTFKRHLIMFFKEAIHNCARYAHATQVRICVGIEGSWLSILVADNGCGFDPAKKQTGWGLKSMKRRAAEMDGHIHLESSVGKGTTVELRIPISRVSSEPKRPYRTSN